MKNNSILIAIVAFLIGAAAAWFVLSSQQPVAIGMEPPVAGGGACPILSQLTRDCVITNQAGSSCEEIYNDARCQHLCFAKEYAGCND